MSDGEWRVTMFTSSHSLTHARTHPQVLLMFKTTAMLFPDFNSKHCRNLFEKITMDTGVAPQVHAQNKGNEIVYDEWVEMLCNVALLKNKSPDEKGNTYSLEERIEAYFEDEVYLLTERFYPGRL